MFNILSIEDATFYYKLVVFAILVIVITFAILEVYFNLNKNKEDNINHIVLKWSEEHYFITFAWGVIGGHLFLGSANSISLSTLVSVSLIVVIVLGLVLLQRYLRPSKIGHSVKAMLFVSGVLLGHFIWSMNIS